MHFWAWFPFSLVATLCFGVSSAFFKMPGVKGHSRHATTFWIFTMGSVLSSALFFKSFADIDSRALMLGVLWGSCLAILNTFQMYGLTHMETNILFPVSTILSLILTVLTGLFVFNDSLSLWQGLGIVLTVAAVYAFLYEKGRFRFSQVMLFIFPAMALLSAFGKIVQKIAVDAAGAHVFLISGYTSGAVVALLVLAAMEGKKIKKELFSDALRWGALNGALAFFGSWTIMIALARGPFTLITAIHSMYIFVAAIAGYVLFHETLDRKKIALIGLSVVAVVLMRIH